MTTRAQALASGLSSAKIRSLLARGLWQSRRGGVYLTFNGPIPRLSFLWAAVLAAGEGATLSHHSAAELSGFGRSRTRVAHVTIPHARRAQASDGVVIHRSRNLERDRHPIRTPPQTRVEATALDLADSAMSLDEAVGWLTSACSRRLTTPSRLIGHLDQRERVRWRRELTEALRDVGAGAHSVLERRYLRDVERAHGLPAGRRQARRRRFGGQIYDDVRYAAFCLVVELDGRVAHSLETTFRDLTRDNVTALGGDLVLHYGWDDVTEMPCRVAAQVAQVLMRAGWRGVPKPCGRPECAIGESGR